MTCYRCWNREGIPIPPSKPKIWSLADTAVCKTPGGEESELVRQLRVERQQLARELEMERASREKRERQIERRTRKETLKEFGISPPSARSVRSESPQSPRFPGSPRSAR